MSSCKKQIIEAHFHYEVRLGLIGEPHISRGSRFLSILAGSSYLLV